MDKNVNLQTKFISQHSQLGRETNCASIKNKSIISFVRLVIRDSHQFDDEVFEKTVETDVHEAERLLGPDESCRPQRTAGVPEENSV